MHKHTWTPNTLWQTRAETSSSSFLFLRFSSSLAVGAGIDEAMDPSSEASAPPAPAGGAAAFLAGDAGLAAAPPSPPPAPAHPWWAALLIAARAGVVRGWDHA